MIALVLAACGREFVLPKDTVPNLRVAIPAEHGPILLQHPALTVRTSFAHGDARGAWVLAHHGPGYTEDLVEVAAGWDAARRVEGEATAALPPPPLPRDGVRSDLFHVAIDLAPGVVGAVVRDDPETDGEDPFAVTWTEGGGWARFGLAPADLSAGTILLDDGVAVAGLGTDRVRVVDPGGGDEVPLAATLGGAPFWTGAATGGRVRVVYAPDDRSVCSGVVALPSGAWSVGPGCWATVTPHQGVVDGVIGGTVDEAVFLVRFDGALALTVARGEAPAPVAAAPGGLLPDHGQGLEGGLLVGVGPDGVDLNVLTADGAWERWERDPHVAMTCGCSYVDDPKTCDCLAVGIDPPVNRMVRFGRSLRVFDVSLDLRPRHHALWADVGRLSREPLGPFEPPPPTAIDVVVEVADAAGAPCDVSITDGGAPVTPTDSTFTVEPGSTYRVEVACTASDGHAPYLPGVWELTGAELQDQAQEWATTPFTARGTPLDAVGSPPTVVSFVGVPGFGVLRTAGWAWVTADPVGLAFEPLPGEPVALPDGRLLLDGGDVFDPATGAWDPPFVGLVDASGARQDPAGDRVWATDGGVGRVWTSSGGDPLMEVVPDFPAEVLAFADDGSLVVIRRTGIGDLFAQGPSGAVFLPLAGNCSHAWVTPDARVFGVCTSGAHRWTATAPDLSSWTSATVAPVTQGYALGDAASGALVYGVDVGGPDDGIRRSDAGTASTWLGPPVDAVACGPRVCVGNQPATGTVVSFGLDLGPTELEAAAASDVALGPDGVAWMAFAAGWVREDDPAPRPTRLGRSDEGPFPVRRLAAGRDEAVRRTASQAYAVGPSALGGAAFDAVAVAVTPPFTGGVHPLWFAPSVAEAPCVPVELAPPGGVDPAQWVCVW